MKAWHGFAVGVAVLLIIAMTALVVGPHFRTRHVIRVSHDTALVVRGARLTV